MFAGKAFCFSGEFRQTQRDLGKLVMANGGRVFIKPKLCQYLVLGNKASLRDIQVARERNMVMITESQLEYWIRMGEPPRVLTMDEVLSVAKGMEYDFVWGDKSDDFGAF